MRTTTYTHARDNLKEVMMNVCKDHTPTVITNKNSGEATVMMSLEDYNSLQETFYLLSSPNNAKRLLRSIKQIEDKKGKKRQLIDEE